MGRTKPEITKKKKKRLTLVYLDKVRSRTIKKNIHVEIPPLDFNAFVDALETRMIQWCKKGNDPTAFAIDIYRNKSLNLEIEPFIEMEDNLTNYNERYINHVRNMLIIAAMRHWNAEHDDDLSLAYHFNRDFKRLAFKFKK